MQNIVERWSILSEEKKELLYGEPYNEQDDDQYNGPVPDYLMIAAEKAFKADGLVFPTLNSLRDVEGESGIFIKRERKNNAKA